MRRLTLQDIRQSVREVGRLPRVVKVDPPLPLLWCADAEGRMQPVDATNERASCQVKVTIRGEGPYAAPHRVGVTFFEDDDEPAVAFLSSVSHPMLGDDGEVPPHLLHGCADLPSAVLVATKLLSLNPLQELTGRPVVPKQLKAALAAAADQQNTISRAIAAYAPMRRHQQLFEGFRPEWLAPSFASACASGDFSGVFTELLPGKLYSFDFFTPSFCEMLMEELESYNKSGLPVTRPNSMNNYGVILNVIGMEPMVDRLIESYLSQVAGRLFPSFGSDCDSHHTFTVKYKEGEDLGLDMHTDDSDVTFNVCLGKEFEGAGLQFCGMIRKGDHRKASLKVQHVKGRCLVHPGRLRHGADDIASGERQNLILWLRNSNYRRSSDYNDRSYEKESQPPDPVCVSFTHDRDFGFFKPYTARNAAHKGRGWCPPAGCEYPGFVPDAA